METKVIPFVASVTDVNPAAAAATQSFSVPKDMNENLNNYNNN